MSAVGWQSRGLRRAWYCGTGRPTSAMPFAKAHDVPLSQILPQQGVQPLNVPDIRTGTSAKNVHAEDRFPNWTGSPKINLAL